MIRQQLTTVSDDPALTNARERVATARRRLDEVRESSRQATDQVDRLTKAFETGAEPVEPADLEAVELAAAEAAPRERRAQRELVAAERALGHTHEAAIAALLPRFRERRTAILQTAAELWVELVECQRAMDELTREFVQAAELRYGVEDARRYLGGLTDVPLPRTDYLIWSERVRRLGVKPPPYPTRPERVLRAEEARRDERARQIDVQARRRTAVLRASTAHQSTVIDRSSQSYPPPPSRTRS